MANINYGPPISNPAVRPAMMRHDVLGPGMMIGMTQRAAEYAVGAINVNHHYR